MRERPDERMDQRDVKLLTPPEVSNVVAVARVSLHQHCDLPLGRKVSMGEGRIVVEFVSPELDLVSKIGERCNSVALETDRAFADGCGRRARDLDAVEGVGVAGIPIVGVDDDMGPNRRHCGFDGLGLRLPKNSPVPVEVRAYSTLARAGVGAVGVDHRDDI